MSVGLVYSAGTGRLRSIVVPDSDVQLAAWRTHAGEAMLVVPDAEFAPLGDINAVQEYLNTHTGLTPSGDRAVSVDTDGFVTRADFIDEACGDLPFSGLSLVAHPRATPGWVFLDGSFIALVDFQPRARARTVRSYKNRGRRLST